MDNILHIRKNKYFLQEKRRWKNKHGSREGNYAWEEKDLFGGLKGYFSDQKFFS